MEQSIMYDSTLAQASFDFEVSGSGSSNRSWQTKSRSKSRKPPALVTVAPISGDLQLRAQTLSSTSLKSYEAHREVCAGEMVGHFESCFRDFWHKRYRHYSSTDRFCQRVAEVFNLDIGTVKATRTYLGLPRCSSSAVKPGATGRFSTPLFYDAKDGLSDPLDTFYRQNCYRAAISDAWETYLHVYGRLSPDMIDPADVRFLVSSYPLSMTQIAQMLQVHEHELRDYSRAMGFPRTYREAGVCARNLINHPKHPRFTRIVLRSAQMLYASQGVPLREIAFRIGIDPDLLFTLGEQVIGDWQHPSLKTIQHVIEYTTMLHIQEGGVIRRR